MTQNFVIQFDATESEDRFRFSVVESPAGKVEGEMTLPVSFKEIIPSLNNFGINLEDELSKEKKGLFRKNQPKIWTPQDLGDGLRRMLFDNRDLQKCWRESLGRSGDQLKLFLQFDTSNPVLANLMRFPWELMYSEDDGLPLAIGNYLPIVRYIQPKIPKPVAPLNEDLVRMLVIVSEPTDQRLFQAEKYVEAMKKWETDLNLEIKVLEHATRDSLYEVLTSESFQFLYFIGHGGYLKDYGQWAFALEDSNRKTDAITATELASLVKDHVEDIRLITMLSCDSGEIKNWNGFNKFGGLAGDFLKAGIGNVIAMQFKIGFEAASIFNQVFFKKLLNTRRIDIALASTRKAMLFKLRSNLEWITPVWFSATTNLEIFKPAVLPTVYVNTVVKELKPADVQQDRKDFVLYDEVSKFEKRKIRRTGYYQEFLEEFRRLQGQLAGVSKNVRFEGQANLSMWVALGFVFNRTCGKTVSYRQLHGPIQSYQTWSSAQPPAEPFLSETLIKCDPNGKDLVVTVSIGRNCEAGVEKYLADKRFLQKSKGVKNWLKLSNIRENLNNQIGSGSEALGLALKVGRVIQATADTMAPETIHLFLLGPTGFALFLGRELNATGRIQVHEYLEPSYEPSFVLARG